MRLGLAGRVSRRLIPMFDLEKLSASFQQRLDSFDPGLCVVTISLLYLPYLDTPHFFLLEPLIPLMTSSLHHYDLTSYL